MKNLRYENIHLNDLPSVITEILSNISKPATFLLKAPMGAGKSTFVHSFGSILGFKMVSSPTYSILNEYTNNNICIHHFDLYRLESEEEIASSGVHDLLKLKSDYKFVEWPDRLDISDFGELKNVYLLQINTTKDPNLRLYQIEKLSVHDMGSF